MKGAAVGSLVQEGLSRRRVVQAGLIATGGAAGLGIVLPIADAATTPAPATVAPAALDQATTLTLEAYADTVVPGQKRTPDDITIAGAAPGPSAVVAGALDVLQMPEVGLAGSLPGLAMLLNGQAAGYAAQAGLTLDPNLPPFVALPFAHRIALTVSLTTPGRPDHPYWVLLATLISWAFDTGGAQHTTDALTTGHAGLAWIGFPAPNADGIWRFPQFSYRRQLAKPSPLTSKSGSPA
jgi:enediyne biosynthesis protein E8